MSESNERVHSPAGLESWADAEGALRDFAAAKARVAAAKALADKRVEIAKADLERATAGDKGLIELRVRQLEAFVREHRSELGGAQSRKLDAGRIGFRRASELAYDGTEADLLSRLTAAGLFDCIRVVESVNIPVLRTHPEATLEQVGARIRETETFYVEVPKAPNDTERTSGGKGGPEVQS